MPQFFLFSPTSFLASMIVKKQTKFLFRSSGTSVVSEAEGSQQIPNIFFIFISNLICEKMWFVRGFMSGQLASMILPVLFFFSFLVCFLCFSMCIYLTRLHPRGDQAQLHPQCGVRLPFSQRRAEAAFNNSCAMLL